LGGVEGLAGWQPARKTTIARLVTSHLRAGRRSLDRVFMAQPPSWNMCYSLPQNETAEINVAIMFFIHQPDFKYRQIIVPIMPQHSLPSID
jgi:hypothetical protein